MRGLAVCTLFVGSLAIGLCADLESSPAIDKLRAAVQRDANATKAFWRDARKQGTPLIEQTPGDPDTVLVTFLLQGGSSVRNPLVFASVLPENDPAKQQLLRIPNTDVWYRTYRFRRDLPILYELSPDGPEKLARDPLNPRFVPGPMGGSAVSLPGVRNLEWLQKGEAPEGRQDVARFRSALLANERTVRIYLPPGFTQDGEYDLLFMLDEEVYTDVVPLSTILDNLIAKKRIRPTVAVLIGNTNRGLELSCSPRFSAMLTSELLPWIRDRYMLTHVRARTTIAGSSLGGLAAACAGWRGPGSFGNVIALSGSFRWRPAGDTEPEWVTRQIAVSPVVPVRFIVGVGTHETGTPAEPGSVSLLTANRRLRDVLRAKDYPLVYFEFPGAHEPLSWSTAIVDSLLAVGGG